MFNILAMLPPPVMLLILIVISITLLIAIPKLKNSRRVDKLADELFASPKKHTVDEAIDSIDSNKKKLEEQSVSNKKTLEEISREQEKIKKNL